MNGSGRNVRGDDPVERSRPSHNRDFDQWLSEELQQVAEEDRSESPSVDLRPALRRCLAQQETGRRAPMRRSLVIALATAIVAFAAGVVVNRWSSGATSTSDRRGQLASTSGQSQAAPSPQVRRGGGNGPRALAASHPGSAVVPAASHGEPIARLRSEMGQLDRQLAELRALRTQQEPLVRISSQDGVDYVLPVSDLLQLMEARAQGPSRGVW